MDTQIKVGIVIFFLVASGFVMYSYDRADDGIKILNDDDYEYMDTNYEGLFRLGLAPSTASRQPQINDIDTGIKLKDGDNVYSLIESRTWSTKDYGKTFVVKIN